MKTRRHIWISEYGGANGRKSAKHFIKRRLRRDERRTKTKVIEQELLA